MAEHGIHKPVVGGSNPPAAIFLDEGRAAKGTEGDAS